MNNDLLNSFDTLDINTKRNQISNELMVIHSLVTKYELDNGIESLTKVHNYDINNDKNMREGEMLTFLYEDIYNIENELIRLLNTLNK